MKEETTKEFFDRLTAYNADVVDLNARDFSRVWTYSTPDLRNNIKTEPHLQAYDTVMACGSIFRRANPEKLRRKLERKSYYDASGGSI